MIVVPNVHILYPATGLPIAKLGTDITAVCSLNDYGQSTSGSHTLLAGTNRMIVVMSTCEALLSQKPDREASATYGGVAMTLGTGIIQASGSYGNEVSIHYILEDDLPADGSNTVQVTWANNDNDERGFIVCAYEHVDQSAPEDTDSVAEPTTADDTIENSITSTEGAWIISFVAVSPNGSSNSFTHNESQVEILDAEWSNVNGMNVAVAEKRAVTANTYSVSSTYSTSSDRLTRCAISIKPE